MGYQPGFSPPNSTSCTISSPPNSTSYTISADQISSGSTSTTYYNPQTPNVQYGWACPRCGKINAPWVNQCTCHRESNVVWGSTTTNNPNINIKSGNIAIDKDSISTYTIHNGEIKA